MDVLVGWSVSGSLESKAWDNVECRIFIWEVVPGSRSKWRGECDREGGKANHKRCRCYWGGFCRQQDSRLQLSSTFENPMKYQGPPRILHLRNGGAGAFIHRLPMDWEFAPGSVNCQVFRTNSSTCLKKMKVLDRMSCSPVSWGWDPGIARWVYAPKELSTEIRGCWEDVTWAWARGVCHSLKELQLFRDVIIQSGHRIVWPPMWFEPGHSMTRLSGQRRLEGTTFRIHNILQLQRILETGFSSLVQQADVQLTQPPCFTIFLNLRFCPSKSKGAMSSEIPESPSRSWFHLAYQYSLNW